MQNLFIVLEGIDGSGTSTQASLLRDYFFKINLKAVITSEPSSGPVGNLIREGMKKRVLFTHDEKKFDEQMAYLFAADRHDHLFNEVDGVYKLLSDSFTVISTRYFFSSLAYHCDSPQEFEFVRKLNEKFPNPDVVIYIDNPVDVSMQRMSNRSFTDRYENREKLIRVGNNYHRIFSEYEGRLFKVQGNAPARAIHNQIVEYLEGNFNGGFRV